MKVVLLSNDLLFEVLKSYLYKYYSVIEPLQNIIIFDTSHHLNNTIHYIILKKFEVKTFFYCK